MYISLCAKVLLNLQNLLYNKNKLYHVVDLILFTIVGNLFFIFKMTNLINLPFSEE